jgi:hypothetical protein
MSLNGYGSIEGGFGSGGRDVGMSGAATSAAERGGGSGADARELAVESQRVRSGADLPPGVVDQNIQDYRSAVIAAGAGQRVNPGFFDSRNVVSPAELERARNFAPDAFARTRGGLANLLGSGGILGSIIRGAGRRLGFGKSYDQPTYDMSRFNALGLYEPSVNPMYDDFENEDLLSITTDPFLNSVGPMTVDNRTTDSVTGTGYPGENKNFFTTTNDLISTGVQKGPYRKDYGYLEADVIGDRGIPASNAFINSNFGLGDMDGS